ncbi:MAG: hypothetical protein ACTSYA_08445, partial [Candidatus Kariarchaeaceae archaeon]
MQRITQHKLRLIILHQLEEIEDQLSNLDAPIGELEETIKKVKQEHNIIKSHLEQTYLKIERSLLHFERQYGDQAQILSHAIEALAHPLEQECYEKLDQFLNDHNFVGTMWKMKGWSKEEFAPFLSRNAQEKINDVVLETEIRVQHFMEVFLSDTQKIFNEFIKDISIQMPHGIKGTDYVKLMGDFVKGLSVGSIIVATITAIGLEYGLIKLVGVMLGPIGLAIAGGMALWQVVSGGKGIKERIRSRMHEKLPEELRKSLTKIAINMKDQFVQKLRQIVEAPAHELEAQLAEKEVNLKQLLEEKQLQTIDVEQKRKALKQEELAFKTIEERVEILV